MNSLRKDLSISIDHFLRAQPLDEYDSIVFDLKEFAVRQVAHVLCQVAEFDAGHEFVES